MLDCLSVCLLFVSNMSFLKEHGAFQGVWYVAHYILHISRNTVCEKHAAHCAGMSPFLRDTRPFKQNSIVRKVATPKRNMGSLHDAVYLHGYCFLEEIPNCLK